MRLGLIAVVLPSLVVGCSSSSSGGGEESSTTQTTPPPDESPSGIWEGTYSESGTLVNDLSCLIAENSELACLLFDPANGDLAGGASGSVTVSGDDISGSLTAYAAPGYVLSDGSATADYSITGGTVAERMSLSMTVTGGGATGSVSATFDPIYDRNSSLAAVAGSYTSFTVDGAPASFSIAEDGGLFAQSESGCVANGQVSVIDPNTNGYSVEAIVSSCPGLDGEYSGLAVTTDYSADGANDVFLFGIFNSVSAIVGAPIK